MPKLKNLLVAVDGSPAGYHALAEAIRLAQWSKGTVCAVTVLPSYEGDLSLVGVRNIQSAIAGPFESIVNQAFDLAETLHADITVKCAVGEPHREIVAFASAGGYDTIVLGGISRPLISLLFRGTTTIRIIQSGVARVLWVPEHGTIQWEKILHVAHPDDHMRHNLAQATDLALTYGGELTGLIIGPRAARKTDAVYPEDYPAQNPQDAGQARGHSDRLTHEPATVRHELVDERQAGPDAIAERIIHDHYGLVMLSGQPNQRPAFRQNMYFKRILNRAACPVLFLK